MFDNILNARLNSPCNLPEKTGYALDTSKGRATSADGDTPHVPIPVLVETIVVIVLTSFVQV